MSNVAVHQDQADELRPKYASHKKSGFGPIAETASFPGKSIASINVAPAEVATQKQLVQFQGRYEDKGRIVEYSKPGLENPDRKMDIDAGIMPSLRDGLINDKESKDGFGRTFFR